MINKTDLFIYCDWLEENDIDCSILRTILNTIASGAIGVVVADCEADSVGGVGCGDSSAYNGDGYSDGTCYHYGDGYSDGSGDCSNDGYGDGDGSGDGFGDGDGDGDGDGYGNGYDLSRYS